MIDLIIKRLKTLRGILLKRGKSSGSTNIEVTEETLVSEGYVHLKDKNGKKIYAKNGHRVAI